MPTKRRLGMRDAQEDLDPAIWAAMNDEPLPTGTNRFLVGKLELPSLNREEYRPLWLEHREAAIAYHKQLHGPGSRSSWWRLFDPDSPDALERTDREKRLQCLA